MNHTYKYKEGLTEEQITIVGDFYFQPDFHDRLNNFIEATKEYIEKKGREGFIAHLKEKGLSDLTISLIRDSDSFREKVYATQSGWEHRIPTVEFHYDATFVLPDFLSDDFKHLPVGGDKHNQNQYLKSRIESNTRSLE